MRSADGRLAFFLEGGYDLAALSSSLAETLLAAADFGLIEAKSGGAAPVSFRHEDEVTRARKTAAERWKGI